MRIIPIMLKKDADSIHGGMTQTTKMPCKSYSLPTVACVTGFKMSKMAGSICSVCYANKGNYHMYQNNIEPAQHARLESIESEFWVSAMVTSIGNDAYFRWHDSGDIQNLAHFEKICQVAEQTPDCQHWIPTREYAIIKAYIAKHKALPLNIIVRLSAMYPDKPVIVPASLQGIAGITVSNVHTKGSKALGKPCIASEQDGACIDCRNCWDRKIEAITYPIH